MSSKDLMVFGIYLLFGLSWVVGFYLSRWLQPILSRTNSILVSSGLVSLFWTPTLLAGKCGIGVVPFWMVFPRHSERLETAPVLGIPFGLIVLPFLVTWALSAAICLIPIRISTKLYFTLYGVLACIIF